MSCTAFSSDTERSALPPQPVAEGRLATRSAGLILLNMVIGPHPSEREAPEPALDPLEVARELVLRPMRDPGDSFFPEQGTGDDPREDREAAASRARRELVHAERDR